MRTVSWMWFLYFLIGCITGGYFVSLRNRMKKKSVRFVWYEWILLFINFMLFSILVQTFIASFLEGSPQAAWMSTVFLGVPIVVLAVVTFRSVQSRMKRG